LYFNYDEKEHKYLAEIKISNTKNYIDKDFVLNVLKLEEDELEK
jgi:hypothetical protein